MPTQERPFKACCLSPLRAHKSKTNTIRKDRAVHENTDRKLGDKNQMDARKREWSIYFRQRARLTLMYVSHLEGRSVDVDGL